jgi:uncharacterized membrane protein YtjA (UPF0391 family)
MQNTSEPSKQVGEFLPEIRRARLGELTIFDVTESELEILERGSPDSIYLNFAIALLSIAISFSAILATTTIPADRVFQVFVILTVVSYVAGVILLFIWRRNHQSVSKVVATIRKRLPPQGTAEPPSAPSGGAAEA